MSDLVQLVERARRGDAEAFGALIEARQEGMTRVAMAILGDPTDAADALQEALTSIWRGLPGLKEPDRYAAWSDRVLVNACRLVLRRRARRRVREVAADDADLDRDGRRDPPFDEAVTARLGIERALDRLSVDERAVLVLHHLEGRGLDQIGYVLGIPTGTVRSRLHHARRALERAMAREQG